METRAKGRVNIGLIFFRSPERNKNFKGIIMYHIQHVLIPKLINKSIVIDYQTTYDDDRITGEYQTFIVSFAYSI